MPISFIFSIGDIRLIEIIHPVLMVLFQLSYSPLNSLVMLIKYSHKNKAKNYTSDSDGKYVLPYIRQRIHYQLSYKPCEIFWLKTAAEYVRYFLL